MTATIDRRHVEEADRAPKTSLILFVAGVLAMVVGLGAMAGGAFGVWYTWDQAATQDIVTPDDAAIPEAAVRGPFTMWAQADIITEHQLDRTEGLYYAQMDRFVPQVDDAGNVVLDANGEAVLVPNEARASWFDATTLTTALSLGIVSYALSAFAIFTGLTLVAVGFVFLHIRRRAVLI